MKPSGFNNLKNSLLVRLIIIKTALIYSFQEETAYPAENWSNMLSTLFYTVTFRFFISVIYANVNTIAGYNENEMLFFLLIGQLSFYSSWALFRPNISDVSTLVNTGNLDLILTKPLPTSFYISFRKINPVRLLRDASAPLMFVIASIHWKYLPLTFPSILIGLCIWLAGMLTTYCVYFLSVMPAFWLGKSDEVYRLVYLAEDIAFPLEGAGRWLRILLGVIIPLMISCTFTASAMLGKTNAVLLLLWAAGVAILFTYIRGVVWRKALRAYTSASS